MTWSSDPEAISRPHFAHRTQFTDPKWSRRVASNLLADDESESASRSASGFIFHMRTWTTKPINLEKKRLSLKHTQKTVTANFKDTMFETSIAHHLCFVYVH
jgi:hypothetical protein